MKPTLGRMVSVCSLTIALSLISACGGGGGGDSGPTGSPPPTAGGTPGSLNAGLSGKLWFRLEDSPTYYVAEADSGRETKFGNRPTPDDYLVPSPDGAKYLFHSYDGNAEETSIKVYRTSDKALLASFNVPGWVSSYRFSRDGNYLGLTRSPDFVSRVDERGLTVLDINDPLNIKIQRDFIADGDAFVKEFDWLPDNRYVYLRRDGKLITGSATVASGSESQIGLIQTPSGFSLGSEFAVSPHGDKLAVVLLWANGALTNTDVWVGDISGVNLGRLSNTGMTSDPQWSPDGRFIAMKLDTGSYCAPGACMGYCDRWYAPHDARELNTERTMLRVYESDQSNPEILSCRRDIYWTR